MKPEQNSAPDKDLIPIGIKRNLWLAEELLDPSKLVPPEENFQEIKVILYHDMISEYDARLFSEYIYSLGINFSPEFREVEELWRADEENHFQGFKAVNQVLFSLTDDQLRGVYERRANFEPIAHLLKDEFHILLVATYDEIVTVRGYSGDLPIYDKFGPNFSRFIRSVIADEGWHHSKFLRLIKKYHSHRFGEVEGAVRTIRQAEGIPYQATFVMDHIEDVFTTAVLDKSAKILINNLAQAGNSRKI